MSQLEPTVASAKSVVGEELHDDNGDVIGNREFVVDEALAAAAPERIIQALAMLRPEDLAELLANRVLIERNRRDLPGGSTQRGSRWSPLPGR